MEVISCNNIMVFFGNIFMEDKNYIILINNNLKIVWEFEDILFVKGSVGIVFLRDVVIIFDGVDIVIGYVLVNGKCLVYINVVKLGNVLIWDVVKNLKKCLFVI